MPTFILMHHRMGEVGFLAGKPGRLDWVGFSADLLLSSLAAIAKQTLVSIMLLVSLGENTIWHLDTC